MVKVERLSENRVKLVVTVSAEQFDLALDAAFEKVVKDIKNVEEINIYEKIFYCII